MRRARTSPDDFRTDTATITEHDASGNPVPIAIHQTDVIVGEHITGSATANASGSYTSDGHHFSAHYDGHYDGADGGAGHEGASGGEHAV